MFIHNFIYFVDRSENISRQSNGKKMATLISGILSKNFYIQKELRYFCCTTNKQKRKIEVEKRLSYVELVSL